jgi:hypothetical protein
MTVSFQKMTARFSLMISSPHKTAKSTSRNIKKTQKTKKSKKIYKNPLKTRKKPA